MKYIGEMTRPTTCEPEVPWESLDMEDPELEKLARDYNRAKDTANRLRPDLYARIYDYKQRWGAERGTERGWQTALVKMTDFTREQIRLIVAAEEKRRATEKDQS